MSESALEMLPSSMGSRDFSLFRALIHRKTGIWLRDGKQVMLASRLLRRLRHHRMTNFADYYNYLERLRDDHHELKEMINCVTTNKTSFFRESHHFDFLSGTLVPEISKLPAPGRKTIRIWSAACSTGEEPYSIAISVLDALSGLTSLYDLEVIASDIDTNVLEVAQKGIYDQTALDLVDSTLHSRYFLLGKGGTEGRVKVKEEVSRHITFKRINLMDSAWPLDGKYDAIFFRNALIYFNQETQNVFLRRMLRFLRPKGYLILGHSEHVPWLHDAVIPLQRTIYQLRAGGVADSIRPATQKSETCP